MISPCVFFDYGGTLDTVPGSTRIDSEFCAAARAQLAAAMTSEGRQKAASLLQSDELLGEAITAWMTAETERKRFAETEWNSSQTWQGILRIQTDDTTKAFDSVAEELICTLETRGLQRGLRPHVRETMEALRDAGWRVGIISNMVSRRRMPREMEAFGITDLFSPVIQSSEYGFRKPDPSIFHHGARIAGVPTWLCWYVGDTYSRDVLGARRAGYAGAILLTGTNDTIPDEIRERFPSRFLEPDAIVDDLLEVPATLETMLEGVRAREAKLEESRRKAWVTALVFDASDVLYYRPRKGDALKSFRERYGLDDTPPGDGASEEARDLEKRAFTGEIDREQHYREILRLHRIDDPALIEEGLEALRKDSDHVDFFPGVARTLRNLRSKGVRLAVVSNTILPLHDKMKFFEQGGFGDVWDSVILSVDVGARKPDPAIYLRAAEHLGLSPDECAFVGHEFEEISGAKSAGMHTVSFNCAPPIGAERHVECFADLADTISIPETGKR